MDWDYTLITNIERFRRKGDPMLLHCHAVLLENVKQGVTKGSGMRGFLPDPAAEVFSLHLDPAKAWPHRIDFIPPATDPGWQCFGKYELTLADGSVFEMHTLNSRCPLDVRQYAGDIYKVWADLRENVAKYWDRPAMPVVEYLPPLVVLKLPNSYRETLNREAAERGPDAK